MLPSVVGTGFRDTSRWTMAQVKDPVCGMTIEDTSAAATRVHNGTTYFFCSKGCAERFEERPDAFV